MNNRWIKRIECVLAGLLSIVVLLFLFVRATHAGGLWRDEAESVQLARMPYFGDLLQNLHYSSFPVLFSVVLRTYTRLFGATDASLRCFGFAVGVFLLGVAWLHSRTVTRQFPSLLPALIGLNTNFLTVGTSVRGYGIGSVLIVLAFTLTAKLLLQPSGRLLLGVFLSGLASMQILFLNGAVVPAIMLAAAAVFLVRCELKWLASLLFAAALCGGLAYLTKLLNTYGAGDWGKILAVPFSFSAIIHQFIAACGESHLGVSIVWLSIVFLSAMAAVWRLVLVWKDERARERDMLLFGLIAISASLLLHYTIFSKIHNTPREYYFLALICLLAVAADLIVANLCRDYYWIRVTRIILVVVALFAMPILIWPKIIKRQTNIDLLAQLLEQNATQDDLIVVNPSPLGISFSWYYRGHTRWMTLPELSEKRIHRYDLLKAKMEEADPLRDLRLAISETLHSGNRVWLVGGARPPEEDWPKSLPPAPDPEFGWSVRAYSNVWSLELGDFLRTHALMGDVVISRADNVSEIENIPLLAAQGWRD